MKKMMKPLAVAVIAGSMLTGCMGKFALTGNLYDWNKKVDGNRWVQEGVFLGLAVILPVYGLTLLVDGIVLNSVEWWTGSNPVAQAGEQKSVHGIDGSEALMTMRADGAIDVQVTTVTGEQTSFTMVQSGQVISVLDADGRALDIRSL